MLRDMTDKIAARVGIWALRRLYGADCSTDVRDDFPDLYKEPHCLSCDAARVVNAMRDIVREAA